MKKVIEKIAALENISADKLEGLITAGHAVIPLNVNRKHIEKPVAIGKDLKVKINANIGGSPDITDISREMEKLLAAVEYGADTVMDLTIGNAWKEVLSAVMDNAQVPVGTVPAYAAICSDKDFMDLKGSDFMDIIRLQGEMGVDFMTVHAGVTRKVVSDYDSSARIGGMVSRGGKLLYRWMKKNNAENPFFSMFDTMLDIAAEYNITLSLGDGLRPGCLADASDGPQYAELRVLGELVDRCRERNVQVMIEGPGHVPLNKIEENVRMEKEICKGAPFYVLGPLTTDIGAGYDHITGAIGAAFAAWMGADFLCYLTPAEHLHLPDINDVKEGVIASKIAAHSADIARDLPNARLDDDRMSEARRKLDWDVMSKCTIVPGIIDKTRTMYPERDDRACTMCSEYCALIEDKEE